MLVRNTFPRPPAVGHRTPMDATSSAPPWLTLSDPAAILAAPMDPRLHATRVLLAITRERWDTAGEIVRGRGVDAQAFVEACQAADVHPWVHERLKDPSARGLVGPAALDALGALRRRVRRDNLLLVALAEQALALLKAAGVRPVVLKGTDFVHRLYGSIDERTIDDVDLLIRPEELETSLRVLVAAGFRLPDERRAVHYVRSSHHMPLLGPGPIGVQFELHWNLAQTGRFRIDPRALVERALPLQIGAESALRLGDADVAAHLVLHHFTHYFDRRLKWIVDLGRLARAGALDWPEALAVLRDWGAVAPAAAALAHMYKLAPDLVPDAVLRALPLARWRAALALPLRSGHPLELWRGTRRRGVQLYLAALLYERPADLLGWILHRRRRDLSASDHPLDPVVRALARAADAPRPQATLGRSR